MSYASATTPLELIFSRSIIPEENRQSIAAAGHSLPEEQPHGTEIRKLDHNFLYDLRMSGCLEEIQAMRQLASDWNSYGAERPSDQAIRNAILVLGELGKHSILPLRIRPTADESIIFEIRLKDDRHLLEFFSDGDIVWLEWRAGQELAHDLTLEQVFEAVPKLKHGKLRS